MNRILDSSIEKEMVRDIKLDYIRALGIIWVLLIHCIFWLGFYATGKGAIFRSLLLIEMPLLFFATGASNYMADSKNLSDFYLKRFKRILIPYWIYAAVCIIFIRDSGFTDNNLIASWVIPLNPLCPISFLTWALWFIPVYLTVIAILPLLKWYYNKTINKRFLNILPFLLIAAIILLTDGGFTLPILSAIKTAIFYCFWVYLGMFYKRLKINKRSRLIAFIIFIVCSAACILLVNFFGYNPDMQINKMPPTFLFLIYGIGALSILFQVINFIWGIFDFISRNRFGAGVIKQYVKSGYTIYLFHPFAFLAMPKILEYFGISNLIPTQPWLFIIVYFILILCICALIGKCLGFIEKIGTQSSKN